MDAATITALAALIGAIAAVIVSVNRLIELIQARSKKVIEKKDTEGGLKDTVIQLLIEDNNELRRRQGMRPIFPGGFDYSSGSLPDLADSTLISSRKQSENFGKLRRAPNALTSWSERSESDR